jgi:hypothetical protein
MKKLNLLLGISLLLLSLSCTSDDNNESDRPSETTKLLKKLTVSGSADFSLNFYYNSDNTIDKIVSSGTGDDFIKQFYYNNGILDRAEYQGLNAIPDGSVERYLYTDEQLTERQDFYDTTLSERYLYSFANNQIKNIQYIGFNESEYSEQDIFEYDSNGNAISIKTDDRYNSSRNEELTIVYDNKKSPFLNFTPNIVLIDDFRSFKNNPISKTRTSLLDNSVISEVTYTYTYSDDGYATSRTDGSETMTFEYFE